MRLYILACLLSYGLTGLSQTFDGIIGAFEFSGDRQIYVSFQDASTKRLLSKKVEGYLTKDVPATTVKNTIGVVYSTKYQKIFAIYKSTNDKFVAHALSKINGASPGTIKAAFGIIKNPQTGLNIAVYLNADNEILGFSLE